MQVPFERAVEVHGARVLRVVRAVLGPGADAEDAWSETFLSALRAWPDLPDDADVAAWLVTIAHRKAVDVVRASARRATSVAEPPEPAGGTSPPGAGAATPAPGSATHVAGLDLTAAVAALPPRQREAVAYHHLAGLPHTQVARLTGRTPAAVRRSAADGVAALRRAGLDPEEPA